MNSIGVSGRTIASTLTVLAGIALAFAFSATASAQSVPTCNMYANPSSVSYSGTSYNPVTLTWNSTNANSANLTNVGSVATNSSQTFYPSVTTTYVLNVYNSLGTSAQCQATVYVSGTSSGAPSCWITLSNYNYGGSYNYNQQGTLSWGSTNATSASISPNIGSISTSGSQMVYPSGNQMYTMTVYNSQGQSATCQTSQYNQPGYVPGQGNLFCSIYANPLTIQNGQTSYLTWNSTGASSAWLSDGLGNVGMNGSLTVRPENSRTYTLTVTDTSGRTQTCNTYVTVSGGYNPYISLTQIPYTGFDFGPMGNLLYWIALAGFALAAGYLVIYYLPRLALSKAGLPAHGFRMPALATSGRPTLSRLPVADSSGGISAPAIFRREGSTATAHKAPVVTSSPSAKNSTHSTIAAARDSMDFARSESGAPRIVITRN